MDIYKAVITYKSIFFGLSSVYSDLLMVNSVDGMWNVECFSAIASCFYAELMFLPYTRMLFFLTATNHASHYRNSTYV